MINKITPEMCEIANKFIDNFGDFLGEAVSELKERSNEFGDEQIGFKHVCIATAILHAFKELESTCTDQQAAVIVGFALPSILKAAESMYKVE
jgi:hypothetical protein